MFTDNYKGVFNEKLFSHNITKSVGQFCEMKENKLNEFFVKNKNKINESVFLE